MHRVLVIGERPEEAKALASRLAMLGYEAAPSAIEPTLALRSLFTFKPDIVVLDTNTDHCSRELFQLVEKVSELPIVVLGDGRVMDDPVWYLEKGAVNYLTKPVSPASLAARMQPILRRTGLETSPGVVRVGDVEIDSDRYLIRKNGDVVSLTPTEFRLLRVLAENVGRACSHRMLLERVWGEDFRPCSHYLRLYIGYLRQKLEDEPRRPRLLVTEWGVGYRLVAGAMTRTGHPLRAARTALS